MKKILLLLTFLAGMFLVSFAQKATKISPSTRIVIADRNGKLSLDAAKKEMAQMKKNKRNAPWRVPNATETTAEDDEDEDYGFPFAMPKYVNGRRVVQCWISMNDDNYNAIESLGVKIQTKFDGKVTANVPVDALEKVAELSNVTKVSVSKKLKKKTYRSRVLTNVDDVLSYSADANAAGLLQAYDGTGVVLGIIDTGIDFGHQMFLGRIKKKYIYNTTTEEMQEYTGNTVYFTEKTHGTHTSSIAGGSDFTATAYVYTTGTSYSTVSNAKFGGMAPGTDLVLCDLGNELTDANIATCIKNISDYADQVGKPCVISLSLGGHYGPHDGTGDMADVCAQYTGAGKIILFAAGNEGDKGIYLGKNASASSPAMTILSSQTRSSYSVDYGAMISYARTPNVELAVRYYVVNTSTNTILWTSNEITTDDAFVDDQGNIELYGAEISVNDTGSDGTTTLSNYFTAYNNDSKKYGFLCGYMEQDGHNDKWYVETVLYYLTPVRNNYKIGISIYPKNGTCYVDSWPVADLNFTASSATVNGNSFKAGSNESSTTDESSYPSIISVGSYVSSKYWRAGTTSASNQTWTNNGTYQQISMFSSYQPEGSGPTGLKQPCITAPGEVILAAYNSGYNPGDNAYYAYGTNKKLGAMSGTSMATPCAAGITALWLQVDPTLTPDKVKEIMVETAIKDSYVTGTYASHFGQGKIDALAGIKYLLENDQSPRIIASPTSVDFLTKPNESVTKTINVKGRNLTADITATLNDANSVFSIDQTTISNSTATNDVNITITYTPIEEGNHSATITLASDGANNVIVTINGKAEEKKEYVYVLTSTLTEGEEYLIVNRNSTGSGYALGHNGTTITTDGVTVLSNNNLTVANFIEESDVDETSKWTAGSGWTFKNGNHYISVSGYFSYSLAISTISTNWTWDGANNRLYYPYQGWFGTTNYYLGYNNSFNINSNTNSIYLYQKKEKSSMIITEPTSLSFETIVGEPITKTFNVKGTNLKGNITATLSTNQGDVYSIDASTITIAEAESGNGKDVTVTFNPTEFDTFTGTVTLSAPNAENVVITLNGLATEYFDVKISEAGLTTLYLDYPVQIPYDEYDPDILGVFYIYEIAGKELKAARLNETIPAYTGVIVQGNSNTAECPVYRFPRVAEADPLTRPSYLSGSVVNTTVAAVLEETPGVVYTLGRGSDSYINFYRYSGKTLAANKAYLLLPSNNAKEFSLVVDGEEATGIKALETVEDNGAWYTVEGIKLQGKPTRKGVYLHNGKSIIMK